MRLSLYKNFDRWYDGGTIWLYSDPHFNDPESKEMNPEWPDATDIVKLINSKVGRKDTIIFLGDIGDESFIEHVKGYKVLIMGNHDKGVSNYINKYQIKEDDKVIFESESYHDCEAFNLERYLDYDITPIRYTNNGLFREVYDGPLFISKNILLSHEPINLPFGINIHGHCHKGSPAVLHENSVNINICSDVRNFEPVRLDKIVEGYKFKDIHRITIDKAIERGGNYDS